MKERYAFLRNSNHSYIFDGDFDVLSIATVDVENEDILDVPLRDDRKTGRDAAAGQARAQLTQVVHFCQSVLSHLQHKSISMNLHLTGTIKFVFN